MVSNFIFAFLKPERWAKIRDSAWQKSVFIYKLDYSVQLDIIERDIFASRKHKSYVVTVKVTHVELRVKDTRNNQIENNPQEGRQLLFVVYITLVGMAIIWWIILKLAKIHNNSMAE